MVKAKSILPIMSFMIIFGSYCTDNKYSDIEKEKIIQGILLQSAIGSTATSVTCASTVQFSSLGAAGLTSKCVSCHGAGNAIAGIDVSSFSSVSAKVTAGNPEGSAFYTSIKSGSMAKYSDSTLNNAVFCWIKAGAIQ